MDKRAATKGEWRTQESTLHMMALFCGWPGAYAAQQLTRHKTIKAEFQLIFKATVLLNFFAFVLVASPSALHGLTLLLGGH